MSNAPTFHTALFRQFSADIEAEILKVMTESVASLTEPAHAHAERIGRINGLRKAQQVAVTLDKQLAGVST